MNRPYEADRLLCECGSKLEVISVIDARTRSDVVAKILKHINFVFDALPLPARPPPSSGMAERGPEGQGGFVLATCVVIWALGRKNKSL